MISKRYGKAFLFFTIIVMMMVCYGAPSSSYAMASYDGFFAAPIKQLKWKDCEIVREIKNGMLEMKARSSVNTSAVVMNQLGIRNVLSVFSVQADVVPVAFNNPSGARPRVGIGGWGYNDGTGSTGSWLGDVVGEVFIGGTGTSPVAMWQVTRLSSTTDVQQGEIIGSGVFPAPVTLGNVYTLYWKWDGSKFTFRVNGQEATFTPSTSINPPNMLHGRYLNARITFNSGKESSVYGRFDNVYINDSDLLDDFSSSLISSDKWDGGSNGYELVREIRTVSGGGKLELTSRVVSPSNNMLLLTSLGFTNPQNIKAFQVSVTPDSLPLLSTAMGGLYMVSRALNDGSPGSGFVGDIAGKVAIAANGGVLNAVWRVDRHTNPDDPNIFENIASGVFSTPVTIGGTYQVYVEWNGDSYVFKINNEVISVTKPANLRARPANRPFKGINNVIRLWGAGDAYAKGYIDNVLVSYVLPEKGKFTTQEAASNRAMGGNKGWRVSYDR